MVVAALASAPSAGAVSNAIVTFAGNGTQGTAGDGGPATAAQLASPIDVGITGSGVVLITDFRLASFTTVVRAVATNGTIATVAGGGSSTADGVPATQADLGFAREVEPTADGGYLLDEIRFGSGQDRVRKVGADGILTTVAGTGANGFSGDAAGPATAQQLSTPSGLAAAGDGTFLIGDNGNHRVRLVSPTGTMSTFAGSGPVGAGNGDFAGDGGLATAARLNFPGGIALQSDGSVLIADTSNNRVRRVVNGVITTVAGTGSPDDGSAPNGDGGPATAARLRPGGVAAIPNSAAFLVSDLGANRVRLVGADGTIQTIAGTGTAGYNGDGRRADTAQLNIPFGLAAFADGSFVVADQGNRRVRFVGPDNEDDGFPNAFDVCPAVADPAQTDSDGDKIGDACDPTPFPPASPATTAATTTTTPPVAAPPGARTPPPKATVTAKAAAGLGVLRARIAGGRLDLLVEIARRAVTRGAVLAIDYSAAGRSARFTARITRTRVRIRRRLPAALRGARGGVVELSFAGTDAIGADSVRLRADRGRPSLRLRTVTLRGGVLNVSGAISRRASGIVRVRLSYARADGTTGERHFSAAIRRGRWTIRATLTGPAARGGQVTVKFTGNAFASLSGQQISRPVAPAV